ncbi:MAG TPA: T9SS type A sorting domain-containing protein, partial [Ferruginibacter sp.]|nr:T9SS type A sorting domain-containing protein [Ferruginibacter sp.]
LYACGNSTVVRSTNNGVNWTILGSAQGITNTGRSLVAVTPANPNYVYIIQANGSEFGRMYRSTDAGLNFITTVVGSAGSGTNYFGYSPAGTDAGGQGGYDMALTVSPTDASEVYLAGIIVWKSTNGGMSFIAQTVWSYPNGTGYNHADVHGLRWVNNTLYSNSDGGIFKSTDRADNWTNISTGLGIRQFYRIAVSQTDANVITGGAQDNGSVARKPAGNWVDWLGADGMEGLISPTNAANIWGTSQNGSLYRSTNGGNSYSGMTKPSAGNWITPLASHPTVETTIYGGWTGFYRSTNSGSSWTLLSGTTITAALDDIAIAPSNTNYLYASRGSTLYVSTDGGATWVTRTAPGTISDICVHRTIPDKIYITTTAGSNNLQVSTNAGASFTSISSGLPAVAARSVVIENNAVQGLYVGMNTGVYYKNDTMSAWKNYTGNLPTVAVNELEIQYNAGKLRVATYGRGVWETPLFVGGVVAVKWLSFTAVKQAGAVRLNWNVSGEKSNTRYQVERSEDGVRFDAIGTINGTGNAGYTYTDHNHPAGIMYYRIREINADHSYYSHIIAMMPDNSASKLLVAPNPVTDGTLRFSFAGADGQPFEADVYSADGRVMLVHKQTDATGRLSVAHLPNGIYTLLIRQGSQQYKTSFVKSN